MSGDRVAPVRLHAARATKRYQSGRLDVVALHSVSVDVRAGEVVVLMGPSGSGKTTLLALLAGWVDPDAGYVRLGELGAPGAPVTSPAGAAWTEVALMPQGLGLLDDLTLAENVALPLRWAPVAGDRGAVVTAQLERFGIGHLGARRPGEASLGEQQRAALARALVTRATVVLADEPTAHQDRRWATEVFNAFRLGADAGSACVVATHDHAALDVADRVVTLRDGEVV
jgi:putative ABC transport system ATP-binding protein